MTFRERFMKGETPFEAIFDDTDDWNLGNDPRTLREYLGLTAEEEDVWISESDEALEALLEQEKNQKILFLDMDGTLLTDEKVFTSGNRKAIKAALAEGHQIVITTGRPLVSAIRLAGELQLTGKGCFIIAYNGGEIYDIYHKKSIYCKTIPIPQVRHLFALAREWNLHCQTYNRQEVIAEKETPELAEYCKQTGMEFRIVSNAADDLTEEPVKLIVMDLVNHQKLLDFQTATEEWCQGKFDRVFSNPQYLEHIAPGISKGNALRILCDTLQIPLSNTIAAGDAPNDISMIETAALGVAMANADPEVKEVADYITKRNNNEDGVSEIIGTFMLRH